MKSQRILSKTPFFMFHRSVKSREMLQNDPFSFEIQNDDA